MAEACELSHGPAAAADLYSGPLKTNCAQAMEEKQIKTVVLDDDYVKNVIRSGESPDDQSGESSGDPGSQAEPESRD